VEAQARPDQGGCGEDCGPVSHVCLLDLIRVLGRWMWWCLPPLCSCIDSTMLLPAPAASMAPTGAQARTPRKRCTTRIGSPSPRAST
jgi:hypothetical protein